MHALWGWYYEYDYDYTVIMIIIKYWLRNYDYLIIVWTSTKLLYTVQ